MANTGKQLSFIGANYALKVFHCQGTSARLAAPLTFGLP
jgi:hypothetical protein